MKRIALFYCFLSFTLVPSTLAQLDSFGARALELRGISSDELLKPNIPDDALDNPPGGGPVPRPLYLVKRYYSCSPWTLSHVRNVFTTASNAIVEIDTGNEDPALQLVTEQNEARLGLPPGSAVTHPAYGLYCIQVRICIPWDQWQPLTPHQFYVRFHHLHPYICWWDHWWYYWRHPRYVFLVNLNSSQEVPPNTSQATGAGRLFLDPLTLRLCYDINYSGLVADYLFSHIHGPAGVGTNAPPIHTLDNIPAGPRAGRLFGQTSPYSLGQVSELQSGLHYVNIHSAQFPNGEIRGQIQPSPVPVYCPWGPSWIPLLRWGRSGGLWCLTVTHPYGFAWDPWYQPRPFCLYGLRYYFTPHPALRTPPRLAFIRNLTLAHQPPPAVGPWLIYPKPAVRYWPYSPYCGRWYWWSCTPFTNWRWTPPIVQFATWVNPDPNDPGPGPTFPDDPLPIPGTVGVSTMRALVSQQGDLNGDGVVNAQDSLAYRAEQGHVSQDNENLDTDTPSPAPPDGVRRLRETKDE